MKGPSIRHVASLRTLLLTGSGVVGAAVVTVFAADAAPTDADGVARMLGDAANRRVASEDFVWAPPAGALTDAVLGRWVVFAARNGADAPRDLFLARVRLTRAGRPFDVGVVRRLTETPYGDEHALQLSHGRISFVTDVEGESRAITVISGLMGRDARPRLVQARFPRGTGPLAHEVDGSDLLVAARGGSLAARVALEEDALDAEPGLSVEVVRAEGDALILPEERGFRRDDLADRWPVAPGRGVMPQVPASASALPGASVVVASRAPGADALITRVDDTEDGATVVAFDMRQLDVALVPGSSAGTSRTGLLARGAWPAGGADRIVAVIRGPSAPRDAWVGLFDEAPIQPPSPALNAFSVVAGSAQLGPVGIWPDSARQALQLPTSIDASARRRSALCIHAMGQLSYVIGEHVTPDQLGMACARWGGAVAHELVRDDDAHGMWVKNETGLRLEAGAPGDVPGPGARDHLFAFVEHVEVLAAALAELVWRPAGGDQPTPAFVPAIWESSTEELGEAVRVLRVAPGRLTWRLRAGTEERSHREGGDFPEGLAEVDVPRAIFGFSVGVGKRRSPNGLRIEGSTGHKFHDNPVLSAEGTTLRIGDTPSAPDAVELEASVREGKLLGRARERGPRQQRGDICLLDDGAALIATSVSDSHEVNASVLVRLGCATALVLDRGAERETWVGVRNVDSPVGGTHVETAFIGLDTPWVGRVRDATRGP